MALEFVKVKVGNKEYNGVINDGKVLSIKECKLGKEKVITLGKKQISAEGAYFDERDGHTLLDLELADASPDKGEAEDDNKSAKG